LAVKLDSNGIAWMYQTAVAGVALFQCVVVDAPGARLLMVPSFNNVDAIVASPVVRISGNTPVKSMRRTNHSDLLETRKLLKTYGGSIISSRSVNRPVHGRQPSRSQGSNNSGAVVYIPAADLLAALRPLWKSSALAGNSPATTGAAPATIRMLK
jgi:hypothetical protein